MSKWLHGLIGGSVGGVAASGLNWLTTNAAHSAGLGVPAMDWKGLGISLLTAGLVSAFAYLKQSPVPPDGQ
ncbi:MAG: hypothetical protein KGL39_27985 [Patescibacteria group bacterium]|nr:hypothetical protein [Patescibacteria group bacterium]